MSCDKFLLFHIVFEFWTYRWQTCRCDSKFWNTCKIDIRWIGHNDVVFLAISVDISRSPKVREKNGSWPPFDIKKARIIFLHRKLSSFFFLIISIRVIPSTVTLQVVSTTCSCFTSKIVCTINVNTDFLYFHKSRIEAIIERQLFWIKKSTTESCMTESKLFYRNIGIFRTSRSKKSYTIPSRYQTIQILQYYSPIQRKPKILRNSVKTLDELAKMVWRQRFFNGATLRSPV